MIGYLYYHLSPSGKYYVGQTYKKPEIRWSNGLRSYTHNKYLISAINKYGWDNFEHKIILSVESNDKEYIQNKLNNLEIEFVSILNV